MDEDLRDTILEAIEKGLEAQLRAVKGLRRRDAPKPPPSPKQRMSQVNMAYDILMHAGGPLHVSALLERIQRRFGEAVDRESLVSALTKKVARGDRFVRTDKNTFGLREDAR